MSEKTEVKDLRSFLKQAEKEFSGSVLRIDHPIDSKFEFSAVLVKLQRMRRAPIVIFNNIKNTTGKTSSFPMVTNVFASRALCAMALGTTKEKVALEYAARERQPIPPMAVSAAEAPVKQVCLTGKDIDLGVFPIAQPYHMEGGRTILASVLTTVDHETQSIYNCAYQTMRMIDARHTTVALGNRSDNYTRHQEWKAAGKPTPIVAWIGHHPAACMAAQTRVVIDQDEYAVIGGMLGTPLRVVPSETWGKQFMVPADAEIVIEGLVSPTEFGRHGLRADFAGYYDAETIHPLMEVTAITRRRDAYYHNIHIFSEEQSNLSSIALEGAIFNAVRQVVPSVRNVHLPSSGCGAFHIYIQLKKTSVGQGQAAIAAALPLDNRLKHVIVVDEDVDIFDDSDVLWAVATRSRWDRDLVVLNNMPATNRDPTCYAFELGPMVRAMSVAKGGIDATMPPPPEPFEVRIKVPDDVMQATDLDKVIGAERLNSLHSDR